MSIETPLLLDTVANAVVDYKGRQVLRSNSGGWRSACFIIGVEVAERFAYYGISCNLEMYLTEQLGQSTVTAAENVNTWSGTASLQTHTNQISFSLKISLIFHSIYFY
ncbi:protein nrt1/ ptr family 5.15 [Quercus suber]|uniref:Protein nrt1/ ptr family 5.15 n=1 Tax=Quercus suber TaxID=58331 RepID=A0AAW0J938_QUESU